MTRILVVNGPNLNLLGKREPDIYGDLTLEELNQSLNQFADDLGLELKFYQANSEGDIIDYLQKECGSATGLIINPGAYSHYSYAIREAITALKIEAVEVHFSNIYGREEFRQQSVIAPVCRGQICGFGFYGYAMALSYFADIENGGQE